MAFDSDAQMVGFNDQWYGDANTEKIRFLGTLIGEEANMLAVCVLPGADSECLAAMREAAAQEAALHLAALGPSSEDLLPASPGRVRAPAFRSAGSSRAVAAHEAAARVQERSSEEPAPGGGSGEGGDARERSDAAPM